MGWRSRRAETPNTELLGTVQSTWLPCDYLPAYRSPKAGGPAGTSPGDHHLQLLRSRMEYGVHG